MKFIHEVKSPRVIFHKDSINTIAEELDAIGSKRVLLVFDISFNEIADRIETFLGSRFAAKIAGCADPKQLLSDVDAESNMRRLEEIYVTLADWVDPDDADDDLAE